MTLDWNCDLDGKDIIHTPESQDERLYGEN